MTKIFVKVQIDSPMRQPRDQVVADLVILPGWQFLRDWRTDRMWTLEYTIEVTNWIKEDESEKDRYDRSWSRNPDVRENAKRRTLGPGGGTVRLPDPPASGTGGRKELARKRGRK